MENEIKLVQIIIIEMEPPVNKSVEYDEIHEQVLDRMDIGSLL